MTFRIVIRDVRTGNVVSVRSESATEIPGLEAGDEILEVILQNLTEGREMTPEECKALPATPGFTTVGAYELPQFTDAVPALNPLALAPWVN